MPRLQPMAGTFDDNVEVRVEVVEAKFENKSAHVSDITVDVVTVSGSPVPTEAWSTDVTNKVNAIKQCLVDHDLMEAS